MEGERSSENIIGLATVVDLLIYLMDLMGDILKKLRANMDSFITEFPAPQATKYLRNAFKSLITSTKLIINLMPSKERCYADAENRFWSKHFALYSFYYDTLILFRYSFLSALSGLYSAAYLQLRSAMESLVRGVIYDLLIYPEYRRDSEKLRQIGSYRGGKTFLDLIELMNKRWDDKILETSASILDLIDELEEFNPKASFIPILDQLVDWNVIDSVVNKSLVNYYELLSKHVHRIHPKFSEIGIRVELGKDWLSLEPAPEKLREYLTTFSDLIGWITYLILSVLSLNLERSEYKNCIEWNSPDLSGTVRDVDLLARSSKSWNAIRNLVKSLQKDL